MKKNLFKIIALLAIGISLTFLSVTAVRADVTANFWTKAANGQLYTNSGNGLGNAVINVAGCNGCGGGGGGGGTVTSVGLSLPSSVFNITGSPVTTSGTFTVTFDTQAPNLVFAGPASGVAATPTFRSLTIDDLPAGAIQDIQSVLDTGNSAEDQSLTLTSSTTSNVSTLTEVGLLVDSGSTAKSALGTGGLVLYNGANANALVTASLTGNRTQTLQDRTGTIANLDQIPTQVIDATSDALYSGILNAGAGGIPLQSIWFGLNAGVDVVNGVGSIYLGTYAGYQAYSANHSTFIGDGAGIAAENASGAIFLGTSSGFHATNAANSVFIGNSAGYNSTNSSQAVAIGYGAGSGNSSASEGIWIGSSAGANATGATNSIFMGTNTGSGAVTAQNSIFIGKNAGNNDTVNNGGSPDDTSILIGQNSSTGGFSNSVAIGNGAVNTAIKQFLISSPINPFDSLVVDAGLVIPRFRTISANDDALLSDYTILVDTSVGGTKIQINLDTNTPPIGQIYVIKDIGLNASANNIELRAGTIIGDTLGPLYTMITNGASVTVQQISAGTWIVID